MGCFYRIIHRIWEIAPQKMTCCKHPQACGWGTINCQAAGGICKIFYLYNLSCYFHWLIFIFISSLFIIIQSISIHHNFFESLNELLFIYLWWYFIFSMYGLYRKEHYLRLLEPIKFSLNPIYIYKLVKRSIKIRFIVNLCWVLYTLYFLFEVLALYLIIIKPFFYN